MSRAAVLSPLDEPFTVSVSNRIDLDRLREATECLAGNHDFSAFALAGGAHHHPFRTVFSARWREDGDEIRFLVEGDGFLRGMVRALVGTLLEVGLGKRSVGNFESLLTGGQRSDAGPSAPAKGLVLERVDYPEGWVVS